MAYLRPCPVYRESSEYRIVSTQRALNVVGRKNDFAQGWDFFNMALKRGGKKRKRSYYYTGY